MYGNWIELMKNERKINKLNELWIKLNKLSKGRWDTDWSGLKINF